MDFYWSLSSHEYRRWCNRHFFIRQQIWYLGILEDYHKLLLDSNGRLDGVSPSETVLFAFVQLTGRQNVSRWTAGYFNSFLREVFKLDGPHLNFMEQIQRLISLLPAV